MNGFFAKFRVKHPQRFKNNVKVFIDLITRNNNRFIVREINIFCRRVTKILGFIGR